MESLGGIARALIALALVSVLIVSSFMLFVILLAVAGIAGAVLWLRRQAIFRPRDEWGTKQRSTTTQTSVTIIDGTAEEVPSKDSGDGHA